jgi:hypothetical protein
MLRFEIGERWFEGEGSSRERSESERDHLLAGGEGVASTVRRRWNRKM